MSAGKLGPAAGILPGPETSAIVGRDATSVRGASDLNKLPIPVSVPNGELKPDVKPAGVKAPPVAKGFCNG